jgi:hypothetical protein
MWYKYSMRNYQSQVSSAERDPRRRLQIQNPHDYRGQLGGQRSDYWAGNDTIFIVNGYVNKADENYDGQFEASLVGFTNIVVGNYVACDADIEKLARMKVTAVLGVRDAAEQVQTGITFQDTALKLRSRNIITAHQTLNDFRKAKYIKTLLKGCKRLHELLQAGHLVYIQDTTGVSRAPTLVCLYLALYCKVDYYLDIERLRLMISE